MKPIYTRHHIPFFYEKTENEFRQDIYERYDEMVVRQTALHLCDDIHGIYPFKKILDWVFENITTGKNRNIVDLGCGVGRLAAELAKKFPDDNIMGIDFSYQMLRRAHEFWREGNTIDLDYSSRGFLPRKIYGEKIPNLKFGLAKAEALPFSDNSQHIIIHTFLFDRLENAKIAIQEIYRVLNSDGYMLMVTPLNFQEKENWELFFPTYKISDFLEKEGWEIISQNDKMEVREPLDGRGNYILWKCLAVVAKK